MIELDRRMEHRWIIDKNVNSKDILSDFTSVVKAANNGFDFNEVIDQVHDSGTYKGRSEGGSTITIGVRLLQTCFYMFGYTLNTNDKRKIFMPSPMTMNILTTSNHKQQAENYLVNLFCIQYPHPFNWTPDCFQLYIGRLFVKLLLDERIEKKLYIDECIWFLPFIERVTAEAYEELVHSILEYRRLNYTEKWNLFCSIRDYNYLFSNVTHEMNYYFLRLFKNFDVFSIVPDKEHNCGHLFKFKHGKGETFRNDAWESRRGCSGYVTLSETVYEAAEKLARKFSAYDIPTKESDEDILNRRDWLTNIYEIEPLEYLITINSSINRRNEVSAIVSEMVHASKFGSRDGKEFERALDPFMGLFRETMDVEIISGSGNTDLLCTMENMHTRNLYKMNVEAKTRGSALEEVNPARIMKHVHRHGADFCVIVAPRFARGVQNDIKNCKIVTAGSEALGAYCLHECIESRDGHADFSSIYDIINNNLGNDITAEINTLTEERYGWSQTNMHNATY